jgi:hypothetical protein
VHEKQQDAEDSDVRHCNSAESIKMVVPAEMVEQHHQHRYAPQEIQVRGSTLIG